MLKLFEITTQVGGTYHAAADTMEEALYNWRLECIQDDIENGFPVQWRTPQTISEIGSVITPESVASERYDGAARRYREMSTFKEHAHQATRSTAPF